MAFMNNVKYIVTSDRYTLTVVQKGAQAMQHTHAHIIQQVQMV